MADEQPNDLIIYNTADGKAKVALYAREGRVWLSQQQLAELFATSVPNISMHIANILEDKELSEISVVKYFLTTAADGKEYKVAYYALEMIIAIGFRVRSKRGTQFRIWANQNLREYMIKGFVMDDERLKNPDGRPDYFDEQLARIRDIRASEKRFYQKIRDLFALCSDYEADDKATQMFFAETQNKLLYAVAKKTAAELICERADAARENMGLTSWKGAIVRKQDILTAKNYLTADEVDTLNRLVVIFLETAELRLKNRQDVTMDFWRGNVERLLAQNELPVLQDKGAVSHDQMEKLATREYETYDRRRKQHEAECADQADLDELKALEDVEQKLKRK